ncbi:hypothetical protein [Phormidesmis priestleyi]|uniref:hypothetical protein n=1 Tax=Phormidesmis priestleyi TaxID=268141 RepID=UPI0012E89147|nr:hypothetical protein [Phormidesmis priestleyi]
MDEAPVLIIRSSQHCHLEDATSLSTVAPMLLSHPQPLSAAQRQKVSIKTIASSKRRSSEKTFHFTIQSPSG